jgi:hypothetical protein
MPWQDSLVPASVLMLVLMLMLMLERNHMCRSAAPSEGLKTF